MDYIDNWKNVRVFEKQLELNLSELNSDYPQHWTTFLHYVKKYGFKSILDLGCGCGVYGELCRREIPEVEYHGSDYSSEAIAIAKSSFKGLDFFVGDIFKWDYLNTPDVDVIHAGALLDVLPNGNQAFIQIHSIAESCNCENIIIGRIRFTPGRSGYSTYKAYDLIDTYEYRHNRKEFMEITESLGYYLIEQNNSPSGETIFLRKKKKDE